MKIPCNSEPSAEVWEGLEDRSTFCPALLSLKLENVCRETFLLFSWLKLVSYLYEALGSPPMVASSLLFLLGAVRLKGAQTWTVSGCCWVQQVTPVCLLSGAQLFLSPLKWPCMSFPFVNNFTCGISVKQAIVFIQKHRDTIYGGSAGTKIFIQASSFLSWGRDWYYL